MERDQIISALGAVVGGIFGVGFGWLFDSYFFGDISVSMMAGALVWSAVGLVIGYVVAVRTRRNY